MSNQDEPMYGRLALALAIGTLMGALVFLLNGCANIGSGQIGLSEATLVATCSNGNTVTYRAPFGATFGTVSASCAPDGKGGYTVTVTNGWDPMALVKLGAGLAQ